MTSIQDISIYFNNFHYYNARKKIADIKRTCKPGVKEAVLHNGDGYDDISRMAIRKYLIFIDRAASITVGRDFNTFMILLIFFTRSCLI